MKTEQLAAMTSEELQIHADSLAAKMSAEFLLYATLRSRGHSKAYSAEHYKKRKTKLKEPAGTGWQLENANPIIPEYIETMRILANRKAAEKMVATAADKRQWLVEIIEKCLDQKGRNYQPRAAIAAIAELNQMDGDRAAIEQKIEQKTTATVDFTTADEHEAAEAYRQMIGEDGAGGQ